MFIFFSFAVGVAIRRYEARPGAKLSSSRKTVSNKSPEECVAACTSEGGFVCRSFDYQKSSRTCYLSDKSSVTATVNVDTSNAFDYYELSKFNQSNK